MTSMTLDRLWAKLILSLKTFTATGRVVLHCFDFKNIVLGVEEVFLFPVPTQVLQKVRVFSAGRKISS